MSGQRAARKIGGTPTIVAVLLAVSAVVAAGIGARAATLGDSGSDTWHGTIRADVKRGTGIVEDARFLYEADAPLAFQIAESGLRAQEAERAAGGAPPAVQEALRSHGGAQESVVRTLIDASELASKRRYRAGNQGFDLTRRLADLRAENPELVALDPDAAADRAAELNLEASLLMAATIPLGLAFLCGALAHGFPVRRPRLVPAGFALVAAGSIAALIVEVVY